MSMHLTYVSKEYPLVRSKRFQSLWYIRRKPCTYILHRVWYYLQTDRNELPLDQRQLEVPSGVPEKISMPVVHSVQTVHLSCT
jgi:hypothetical protein